MNIAAPLGQRFPAELRPWVAARYGPGAEAITVEGPGVRPPAPGPPSRYLLVKAQHLYPALGGKPWPAGAIVFRTAHPLQFLPYQYEGFPLEMRAVLRPTDIGMALVDRGAPAD